MKKKIILFFSLIFILNTILALDVSQVSNGNGRGVYITAPTPPTSTNVSDQYTNSSDFWDDLDTPLDIIEVASLNGTSMNATTFKFYNTKTHPKAGIYSEDNFGLPALVVSTNTNNQLTYTSPQNGGMRWTSQNGVTVPLAVDIGANRVSIFQDGTRLTFGTGTDAYQQYDGTNWIYNLTKTGNIYMQTDSGQIYLVDKVTINDVIDIHANGGSFNTFIGDTAGSSIVAGAQNTIVGAFSGDAINNGNQNTCIGTSSCGALSSGTANTFMGQGAGTSVTTQGSLTFLGAFAGRYQTGSNNLCVGRSACEGINGNINNGNNNFFLGYYAGNELNGGSQNTGLGAGALQRVGNGNDNICFGTSCLAFSQGSENIAFGRQAGLNYNGSGSMFFGKGIGLDINLPDNILMIDNEAGLNDTLIYGNFEGNNLTINGDLHTTGNFTGNQYYGELWFDDESTSGTVTPIAVAMQWYNISGFNHTDPVGGDLLNGVYEGGDGELIPDVGGVYNVNYEISFERYSGGVSREYEIGLVVNGEVQNKSQSHRTIGNANDVGDAGQTIKLILNGGDRVQMVIRNNGGTENAGVHNAVLGMDRIGN